MTHPVADTLLKFALQMLDEPAEMDVREHLLSCEACRDLHQECLGEIKRLDSIGFHINVPEPPKLPRRGRSTVAVLRWAAVLPIGFLLGYLTAQFLGPSRPIPVPQRFVPTQGAVSAVGYIPCQAVDVNARRLR